MIPEFFTAHGKIEFTDSIKIIGETYSLQYVKEIFDGGASKTYTPGYGLLLNGLEFSVNQTVIALKSDLNEFITEESDPIFRASAAYTITDSIIAYWNNKLDKTAADNSYEEKGAVNTHNTDPDSHADLRAEVVEAKTIAEGASKAFVFDTEESMNEWLTHPENTAQLQIGNHLLIRELDVPDYWWDGTAAYPLETEKVDLSGYVTIEYANQSYEPKNPNIQSHIETINGNPHGVSYGNITGIFPGLTTIPVTSGEVTLQAKGIILSDDFKLTDIGEGIIKIDYKRRPAIPFTAADISGNKYVISNTQIGDFSIIDNGGYEVHPALKQIESNVEVDFEDWEINETWNVVFK